MMNFDEFQEKLLAERYLHDESINGMFNRVATFVGVPEAEELMKKGKFLPNSPTLANAGRKRMGQLSACFVLPIEDNMESIFETLKHTALIHQSGGGTGFNFSNLRPKGDIVNTTRGVASGVVSFMSVYDRATESVKQGGLRRGANMGMLDANHPDIFDFIECKKDEGEIANFNISVSLDDKFFMCLENGQHYQLLNPRTSEVVREVNPNDIFDKIVSGIYENGEPGILFSDAVNRMNPNPELGRLRTTNPCGELPMLDYESCNLGSINLSKFVDSEGNFDYDDMAETIKIAVEFMDKVIDKNQYPILEIREATLRTRKIGLGVMGWADALIKMGIMYDSDEAIQKIHDIMPVFKYHAHSQSKGRHSTVTAIAPTGSISIIANCSSGIEPNFGISETRTQGGKQYNRVHSLWGLYPEELFRTASEINWKWHLKHQQVFQQYIDNAISKTINMPFEATKEDIRYAIMLAYQSGCKGLTMYRENSRKEQVIVKECVNGKCSL